MEILFWVAAFGVTYSYFIYPLLLWLSPRRRERHGGADSAPSVSVIIAAHNEGARIRGKLENTLACDYPADRLEIIVASDASTDDTDMIATAFGGRGVRLVRAERRLGKEHAQALAIARARGEILVFTDAATRLDENGLREIVRPFVDPAVGAVSSEDRFLHADGTPAGEGAYVRYEMALRRLEARTGGLVGLSGSFFAARRTVCEEWDESSPSDFNTALNCARRGMAAVVAPTAFGYYRDAGGGGREYRRKYRTVLRGMASVFRHAELLNPLRHGRFALQVWSHKVMRWAVPWFLPLLLLASWNTEGLVYRVALAAQLAFYGLAAIGLSARLRAFGPVRIACFFMEVNAAIIHATVAFLMGNRITRWEPSRR